MNKLLGIIIILIIVQTWLNVKWFQNISDMTCTIINQTGGYCQFPHDVEKHYYNSIGKENEKNSK